MRAGTGDRRNVANCIELADEVAPGLSEIQVAGCIKDDGRRKDKRNGQGRDGRGLSRSDKTGYEAEHDEKRVPDRSVLGLRRVSVALRTHEESLSAICEMDLVGDVATN